jgi:CheY-like chemotaxis protein
MAQCLVVDQNRQEREQVSALLSGYGFDLVESEDAEAALKICRTRPPDVIFMADRVAMARADFIRRAQKAVRGKRPVVLVYTGEANAGSIGRAILDGAAECLVKPFDRELLEFKLRQVGLL